MNAQLDMVDRHLLNAVQSNIPLTPEPFKEIAAGLGLAPEDVLSRLQRLKVQGVLREISAIFDARRLGHQSCLVAMRFPEQALDQAAHHISQHPGVSHNYARPGYFNLWFTLTIGPKRSLEEVVRELAEAAGAEAFHVLPAVRLFKLGANFDMVSQKSASNGHNEPNANGNAMSSGPSPLTHSERQVVQELQQDLPLVVRPFNPMAQRLGITEDVFLQIARSLLAKGVMRRFSGVLHHRQAGFTANVMVVWRVPLERSEEVGMLMASFPTVSHCYQRPTFPDWPYSHFTMVHATTREECEQVANQISEKIGIRDYAMLYSTREYKKARVRYSV